MQAEAAPEANGDAEPAVESEAAADAAASAKEELPAEGAAVPAPA